MSGHQEYKCPNCGFEYESLEPFDCPRCRSLSPAHGSEALVELYIKANELEIRGRFTQLQVVKIIREFVEADASNEPPKVFKLKSDTENPPNAPDQRPPI